MAAPPRVPLHLPHHDRHGRARRRGGVLHRRGRAGDRDRGQPRGGRRARARGRSGRPDHLGRLGPPRADARDEPAPGGVGAIRAQLLRGLPAGGAAHGAQAVRAAGARSRRGERRAAAARRGHALPERGERRPVARAAHGRDDRRAGVARRALPRRVLPGDRDPRAVQRGGRHAPRPAARCGAAQDAGRDAGAGAAHPARRVRGAGRARRARRDGAVVRRRVRGDLGRAVTAWRSGWR